jgi:signal transduction histidine kinase
MLLINVVMVKFSERDLKQAQVHTGRLLIQAFEQKVGNLLNHKKKNLTEIGLDPQFSRNIAQLLFSGGFSEAIFVNHMGNPFFSSGTSMVAREHSISLAREAMKTGTWSVDFSGKAWGVIWLNNKDIKISAPLYFEGRPSGGITITASLMPIYNTLRKSQKVVLLYILLDTIILLIFGLYLLSRIAVKPIHRLLKMTEGYKGGDIMPLFDQSSRDEIGDLSRSLNIMLKRLEENKSELKANISSLEKANEELQQAQDEIIRSEKLASIGRLAAGIAHEIGNPMGIILGYLEMIKKGDITEDEKEDFTNRMESEITRINQVIQQLLDFSRPSSGKSEKTYAHKLIMNTLNILKPQPMMENIHIDLDLRAPSDTIHANPNQLQQVFLNIMINAADALADKADAINKGSEINEAKASIDQKNLTIKSENTGDAINLRFIDNGPGVPEEELAHIFDPFYTTKAPGRGTGLGLSVCYRIVEGLEGSIRAESAVGEGTTIMITLPLDGKENGENHAGETCPDY